MKFVLNTVSKLSGRCGMLSCFDKFPNKILQTPLLMIYSRGASVPNLSAEVFDYLTSEFHAISISIQSTEHMETAVKLFGNNIQSYAGLDHCLSFVTLKDAAEPCPSGNHENNSMSFYTRHGKVQMTVDRFMNIVETFQPDLYQVLSDNDTNVNSGKKRMLSSSERTEEFFLACLERHKTLETLKKTGLLATISGGYSLPLREKSAEFYKPYEEEISGYVIDGLHPNGVEAALLNRTAIGEVVGHTVGLLPDDKMRFMLGAYNPLMVLELIVLGVDVFDSSYVYLCSKQNRALTFSFAATESLDEDASYHLNLADVKHKQEFIPIFKNCQCLTCQKHTRAYIYHLIDCNELLAQILLTIHNMHHYMKFFKFIRAAITNDSLPQLIKHLEQQMADEKTVALSLPPTKPAAPTKGVDGDKQKKGGKLKDQVTENVEIVA